MKGYRPDFYADEAIRGWVRGEATGNLCLGSKAKVQERTRNFLTGLANWKDEVRRGYRTVLQSGAERSCDTRGPTLGASLDAIPVSITPLFTRFRAPKRPNKILPHSHAYFVPTATNKDPPCTPLGQYRIKFYPISTPESFVKNGIATPKWPGRIFFPTSTPTYPLIRI